MKSKVTLEEDLEFAEAAKRFNTVVNYLMRRHELNFTVGDYLIKEVKHYDEWSVQTVSSVSKIPKRFLCVHEDEFGIKYVRALSSTGQRLPTIMAMTDLSDYERYVLDPEYAEHIIFNGEDQEYDFASGKKQEKAHRLKISKLNRQMAEFFSSEEEIKERFSSLPIGSIVYIGHSISHAVDSSYEFKGPSSCGEKLIFHHVGGDYESPRSFKNLVNCWFFFTEPHRYETV